MALQAIPVPDSIKQRPLSRRAEELIDEANERVEAFMLADSEVIEGFVNCDFWLLDQALGWIVDNHLLTGNRYCELGSGFGVGVMLAALRNLSAIGIEIEPKLAEHSSQLADDLGIDAAIHCGSFVPRDSAELLESSYENKHIEAPEGDVFEEIGLAMNDFDLFFAFPWPDQYPFFEQLFQEFAADGALLMTYRGREGMHLVRKS